MKNETSSEGNLTSFIKAGNEMKKKIIFLLLINALYLFSAELKITSKKPICNEFSFDAYNSLFLKKQNLLLITSLNKGINTNFNKKAIKNISKSKLFLYDFNNDKLKQLNLKLGYKNGCLNVPTYSYLYDDMLYIYDLYSFRINAFLIEKDSLKFKYSIDTKGKMQSYVFSILENNLYGSVPEDFHTSNKVLFRASILDSKEFPLSKDLKLLNTFANVDRYRKIAKTFSTISKLKKEKKNLKALTLVESIVTECAYMNVFTLPINKKLFFINSFGIEIACYDKTKEKIITEISTIKKLRNLECNFIKEKRIQNRTKKIYSQVQKVFASSNKNLVILFFKKSNLLKKITKNNNDVLVIKKITNDFAENLIEIDFTPLEYNDDLNKIYGIKNENGKLMFYTYELGGI